MLVKKKQMLRENAAEEMLYNGKEEDHKLNSSFTLSINLNQPLTDQLAKHCSTSQQFRHAWNDNSYYENGSASRHAYDRKSQELTDQPRKDSRSEDNMRSLSKTRMSSSHKDSLSLKSNTELVMSHGPKSNVKRSDDMYKSDLKEDCYSSGIYSKSKHGGSLRDMSSKDMPRCPTVLDGFLPIDLANRCSTDRASFLGLPGYSLGGLTLPSLPDSSVEPSSLHHMLQQQQITAARLQQLQLLQQLPPSRPMPSPGSILPPYGLGADALITRHLEMVWQQKFPGQTVPPVWMLHQFQDELLRDPGIMLPLNLRDKDTRSDTEIVANEFRLFADQDRMNRDYSEREQKEKLEISRRERDSFGKEKDKFERDLKEHDRLELDHRKWERLQQEAILQSERHYQGRDMMMEEPHPSTTDAVNQHFQASLLQMSGRKAEAGPKEVGRPSYAYTTEQKKTYDRRMKFERQPKPFMFSAADPLDGSQKPQSYRNVENELQGTYPTKIAGNSHGEYLASHLKPEQLNFDLYGYHQKPERMFIMPDRHHPAMEKSPTLMSERSGSKQTYQDYYTQSQAYSNGNSENWQKKASVIVEPRGPPSHSRDYRSHGSIMLGTSSIPMPRPFRDSSVTPRLNSPRPGNVVKDAHHQSNYYGTMPGRGPPPSSRQWISQTNAGTSWNASKLNAAQQQQNFHMVSRSSNRMPTKRAESSEVYVKPSDDSLKGFRSTTLMNTSTFIQPGFIPNPIYTSAASVMSRGSSVKQPKESDGNHSMMTNANDSSRISLSQELLGKRRIEKDPLDGSQGKKFKADFTIGGIITAAVTQSTSSHSPQPATYLDSFKSIVDYAVQNAFESEKDNDCEMTVAEEKLRKHIMEELGDGDKPATPSVVITTDSPTTLSPIQRIPSDRAAVLTVSTPPPAVPLNQPATSNEIPSAVNSPGAVSLSSMSSEIAHKNVEIDTSGCSSSPSLQRPPSSCANSLPSLNSSGHHKFKKTWLQRYSDEDKRDLNTDQTTVPKSSDTNYENMKECFINVSYISRTEDDLTTGKTGLNIGKSEIQNSDSVQSAADSQCSRRLRIRQSKKGKTSPTDSPTMPDLVQENQTADKQDEALKPEERPSSTPKLLVLEEENTNDVKPVLDFETKLSNHERTNVAGGEKSKESFLQDGSCSSVAPRLSKCRECKAAKSQRGKPLPSIFCRFYAFRRLHYSVKGCLSVAGFARPSDANADDIKLWMPSRLHTELNVQEATYLLANVKDQFLDFMDQEKQAVSILFQQAKVVWKKPIQGVREMCDICESTLFNFHLVCQKCGFAGCIDCCQSRCSKTNRMSDDSKWMSCSANRQGHDLDSMMLTQILPSDVRSTFCRLLQEVLDKLSPQAISDVASSDMTSNSRDEKNGFPVASPVTPKPSAVNGIKVTSSDKSCKNRLGKKRLAERSLRSSALPESETDSGHTKKNPVENNGNCCEIDNKLNSGEINISKTDVKHETEFFLKENIPCKWHDSARVLRLLNPDCNENRELFVSQWTRSLPVVVSNCDKLLNMSFWTPESLSLEFGHMRVNLRDCSTGAIKPDQPMDQFWDGFRQSSVDRTIWCLNDWPSAEDLTGKLADHNQDLINCLPLADYTRPTGIFNLVSHLPEYFVRPDFVTRIKAGYGSSSPNTAPFTSLHCNPADSVNVMVYVEKSNLDDGDIDQNVTKVFNEASCIDEDIRATTKSSSKIGAIWHIYKPQDSSTISKFLKKICSVNTSAGKFGENGSDLSTDSGFYMDKTLRAKLFSDYGVQCSVVAQSFGDAVLVPAMSPYQVKNIKSCIVVKKEFLSPESLRTSFIMSQQSKTSSCWDDQLQIKNLVYHVVKDCIAVLHDDASNDK